MSKLNYKTVTLSGAEQEVRISGQNCDIRNDGADIIYAAGESGIAAGNDGVVSIPAGQAVKLHGTNGTVFLLGTGSALLCGNDYSDPVFKAAAATGGGEDTVARTAISTHADNEDIHFTDEKAIKAAATSISNPNLLINSWFGKGVINQRGKTEYSGIGYAIDRWRIYNSDVSVNVTDDGIEIINSGTGTGNLVNYLDIAPVELGTVVTISVQLTDGTVYSKSGEVYTPGAVAQVSCSGLGSVYYAYASNWIVVATYAGKTFPIKSIKLELGSVATPFVPPDPTTELAKCQRYYQRLSGSATNVGTYGSGFIGGVSYATVNINFPNPMRIAPTVTITGEVCLATAGYNGADGVIRTSTWAAGWHSTTNSATVVLDISHVSDGEIGGNACLLQIRDEASYIELSAER